MKLNRSLFDTEHIVLGASCLQFTRLAPSLEQHAGCTIIDINPGIGLWSSKLHEIIKPRNHVLMESKQDVFLPYLSPLLNAPNSRYVLRDWHDEDYWRPQRYVEEGLLVSLEEWKNQGHKHSPILVLANYADHLLRKEARQSAPTDKGLRSHLKAIDLTHAVRLKSAFQAYGPTRLLMWLPDAEKRPLIPRTVGYRGKLAVYMESAFHLEEIAGAIPSLAKIRREDSLNAESNKIVAGRMQEARIQIPPKRQDKFTDTLDVGSSKSRAWHVELAELEEGFKNLKISQRVGKPPEPLVEGKRGPKNYPNAIHYTPEYMRYSRLRALASSQSRGVDKINQVLQKQEEIDKLDLAAQRDGITAAEQKAELQEIDLKTQKFKEDANLLKPKQRENLLFLDDDRRACAFTPPLLSWDRRRADPLIVRPDEFYPHSELALLDFQPLPSEKQFPWTMQQSAYFDFICTNLFGARGMSTLEHLNHVAPTAYEALVPKCPALTDPRKGGRRDVESLRIRTLTPEMLWQLSIAWDEWLFKPSMSDIMTQFGTNFEFVDETRRWSYGV
ncbi:hypothetical protein ACLMJK_000168 [Lecanora helva]